MLVTVAVVARDEESRLPRLLDSLERQQLPRWLQVEVLLVDNGSRDSTLEVMREYAAASRYPVRVAVAEGALGRARNRALQLAKGSHVAFIDADEVAPPQWLARLAEPARAMGCHAVLGPVVFYGSGPVAEYFKGRSMLDLLHSMGVTVARGRKAFNTGNLLLERRAALSVGFREDITVSEDGEFSYRFLKRGYKLCTQPSAVVFHPAPSTGAGLVSYYWKLGVANAALLRYHPNPEMLAFVAGNVAANSYPGTLLAPITLLRKPARAPRWALYSIVATLVMAATIAWPGTWRRLARGEAIQRLKEG